MTKQQTIETMVKMAQAMYHGNYSKDLENCIWDICSMWNSEHQDNEIFMCEHTNDNDVNGFYIEDDYFLYCDME